MDKRRVVDMAGSFPWADHNATNPIDVVDVAARFGEEIAEHPELAAEVIRLVNGRRVDPFDSL